MERSGIQEGCAGNPGFHPGYNWAAQFRTDKEEMGFSLFSILIDVGSSSMNVLKEFSDKITTVSRLTSEGVKDLFVKL